MLAEVSNTFLNLLGTWPLMDFIPMSFAPFSGIRHFDNVILSSVTKI